MVKKLVPLALVVLALAAVPVAFGDNGNPAPGSTTGTTPAPTQTQGQGARGGNLQQRLQQIQDRVQKVETTFAQHCGAGASGAPQKCVDFANRVLARLQKIDGNVQARITKLQACTATSTDRYCTNADKKIALLQQIDQRVQALEQKVQAWLNGTSSSSSSTDSGLDQAAAGLGKLTKQVGGTTP